jgi:iron(III) transport system substrate-binding protein
LLIWHTGCDKRTGPGGDAIVVYTSVDEPVARPILQEFTRRTGIRVETRTDTEANKSAGLAARLEAEKSDPKADVWWGNEVFRTIRLADAGVLAPYDSPSAADIPPLFKDPNHLWGGNALRARVIGVRAEDAGGVEMIEDLIQPKWKGRVAIANPRAGTTSGHVAALYVLWGEPKAQAFFRGLRDNGVKVLGGNGDVASELAKGTIRVGLTDNDDLENVAREGAAVRMVLPDQKSYGTLTIPCTAALVAGAKHPEGAKKLIDHLLSAEVERQLIEAKFARYSVRAGATDPVKSIQVDYREVAKVLPKASNDAHAILVGRE